ncbi:MAG: putative glycoside hydrolase [Candidatus Veblenbacteria bacterium]|nr:putative glycoside hydrolase [Candidatus Veblenbacteria bacterium]
MLLAFLASLSAQFAQPLPPLTAADTPRLAPQEVKAIYVTSGTATLPGRMAELKQLVRKTELNAMVINTKEPFGPRMDDKLKILVSELGQDGIWLIARQVMFQDDELAQRRPELALKKAGGSVWRADGGHTWVDPANREVWEYNLQLARQALELGFNEINLDYIRFPTDGSVKNALYPSWDGVTPKEEVLREFLRWFRQELRASYPYAVLSIDVFGETFLKDSAGNTGQKMSLLAPEVDVVAPMVYPSHYRSGNFGLKNPAAEPYRVVLWTLEKGKLLFTAAPNTIVRPWLQDFNLGAKYTPQMVQAQITATEDAGYHHGFMLWNPKNIYSAAALKQQP